MTELADPKMPGALEGSTACWRRSTAARVTAGEPIELVLTPGSRCAATERSRCRAPCWLRRLASRAQRAAIFPYPAARW